MFRTRPVILSSSVALVLALVAGFLFGAVSPGRAQDDDALADEADGRPVSLTSGGCGEDDVGDEVAPLSDLTPFGGDEVGQRAAITAESSYTNVPLLPEDLQADDHVIIAVGGQDDAAIACGEVGGPLSPNGTLIIGMREQNGSGLSGVAYISPGSDGASTDISVFVAEGLTGESTRAVEPRRVTRSNEVADAEATPSAATPVAEREPAVVPIVAAETVDVSLVEWSVELATELDAGPIAFQVSNDGSSRHSLAVEGEGIDATLAMNLQPGESATLEVDLEPGSYVVYCPVGRHRDRGMETELKVV